MNKADELTLIGGESMMARGDRPAEEGDRVTLLDEDRAKTMRGRVALDGEGLGEVQQGEDGS
jgi:hypothetical protein